MFMIILSTSFVDLNENKLVNCSCLSLYYFSDSDERKHNHQLAGIEMRVVCMLQYKIDNQCF